MPYEFENFCAFIKEASTAIPLGILVHCTFSPVHYFADQTGIPYLPTLIGVLAALGYLVYYVLQLFQRTPHSMGWDAERARRLRESGWDIGALILGYIVGALVGDNIVLLLGGKVTALIGGLIWTSRVCLATRNQESSQEYSVLPSSSRSFYTM